MKAKQLIPAGILSLVLSVAAIGVAQTMPSEGVRASNHENLAAAQQLIRQAYEKIVAAQKANNSDLGGHAKKAEELLDQANQELGMAAEFANQHHRR